MTIKYSQEDIMPTSTGYKPILVKLTLTAVGTTREIEWLEKQLYKVGRGKEIMRP